MADHLSFMPSIALIHSPLVGPFTWALVADELRHRGFETVLPVLQTIKGETPYWKQHARYVAAAIETLSPDRPVVLVAHSGAGMLLPAIRQATQHTVGGYVFVDAGIPEDGASRLDLFGNKEEADRFRRAAAGGFIPVWAEEDLREIIPDEAIRERFVSELRPLPLAVYEEPVPVFKAWPDAPCAYLSFARTEAYEQPVRRAKELGWAYTEMEGHHFHMLVDPNGVADSILSLVRQIGNALENK